MFDKIKNTTFIAGLFVFLGFFVLGYFIKNSVIKFKNFERTVTVKGLSEKEYKADVVIWPIRFVKANNDISQLYKEIALTNIKVKKFLSGKGIKADEISLSMPTVRDNLALEYGGQSKAEFRYSAFQIITVYSKNIDGVRKTMESLSELGRQGIVFTGNNYESRTEYLFVRLNEVKPEMIEEATKKAREVAEKFAADSDSKLGKIKKAYQGQFSITSRDKNNPHIKKIRVVATVEYYLSD